jgi:cytoskeletal protein CcmA (bactofilin family)
MVNFNSGKNGSGGMLGTTRGSGDAPLSILSRGIRLTGTLETSGVVRVEGEVEGDLRARGGQVLVAPGGVVQGDVEAALAVIAGDVRGKIVATELVELKAGSVVHGDITTPRITVEEGGAVNGTLQMPGATKEPGTRRTAARRAESQAPPPLQRVG